MAVPTSQLHRIHLQINTLSTQYLTALATDSAKDARAIKTRLDFLRKRATPRPPVLQG